jgi:16S rRNA (adenine1518-N6/adenine1519-N6)-dimethyltransferase
MRSKTQALGQNFLVDPTIIQKIIALFWQHNPGCDFFIEIGPGHGALTLPFLKTLPESARFAVIEKDPTLAQKLTQYLPDLKVIQADARKALGQLIDIPPLTRVAILANLPYSVGTHILLGLIQDPRVEFLVVMLQKEVCLRLQAPPGSKKACSLGLFVQNCFEVSFGLTVAADCFHPRPQVVSEVICLKRRVDPKIPVTDPALWDDFLKSLFFAPRKMLRAKKWPQTLPPHLQNLRAADLSWQDIQNLWDNFQKT